MNIIETKREIHAAYEDAWAVVTKSAEMREGAGFHEWGAGIRARFNNEKARYLAEANVSNEDGLKEVRRRALANAARWGQQFI